MERQLLGMDLMLLFCVQNKNRFANRKLTSQKPFISEFKHTLIFKYIFLLCSNLTVIDMMVDPDGTLDALSNLGLTSPLTDQKISPGVQQGASGLHPGVEVSSRTLSASRPEGLACEARGSSNHTGVAERDPGPQQSSRSHK